MRNQNDFTRLKVNEIIVKKCIKSMSNAKTDERFLKKIIELKLNNSNETIRTKSLDKL